MFAVKPSYNLAVVGPNLRPYIVSNVNPTIIPSGPTIAVGPPYGFYPRVDDALKGYRDMINQGFNPKELGRPLVSLSGVMGFQSPIASIAKPTGCEQAVLQRAIVKYPGCGNPQYWSIPYLTKPVTITITNVTDNKNMTFNILPQAVRQFLDKLKPYQFIGQSIESLPLGTVGYRITIPNNPEFFTKPLNENERITLFDELTKMGFTGLLTLEKKPTV